jgi:DNA-binding XRE family transcriptional regulator
MKMQTTGKSTDLIFTIPTKDAIKIQKALTGFFDLAGYKIRQVNDEDEKLFSVDEVFPERTPGMLLRGLRSKTEMTQAELAEHLGSTQKRVSELEMGKRGISREMAKKLGEVFKVTYKMFL